MKDLGDKTGSTRAGALPEPATQSPPSVAIPIAEQGSTITTEHALSLFVGGIDYLRNMVRAKAKCSCGHCYLCAHQHFQKMEAMLKAGRAENERLRFRVAEIAGELDDAEEAAEKRITELEGERDTATRALAVLDKIAWLAAEEDSWFGNENDIAVQRAAAERHRAALSKTEGKG